MDEFGAIKATLGHLKPPRITRYCRHRTLGHFDSASKFFCRCLYKNRQTEKTRLHLMEILPHLCRVGIIQVKVCA